MFFILLIWCLFRTKCYVLSKQKEFVCNILYNCSLLIIIANLWLA